MHTSAIRKIMARAPIPSAEEIVRLYETGELAAELARYHEGPEETEETFLQRCIELHNDQKIDLIIVPSQPGFTNVAGHEFFTAQHFYCEAIPKLNANVTALMECCRTLIERAGADGAAGQPNEAFRQWCVNNPAERAFVISGARSGEDLAKRFVTFALQAAGDVATAIDFVKSYDDERRLFAMAALGRMTISDASKAQEAIGVLEPFLSIVDDDNLRANSLFAAFDVLKKHNDAEKASAFVELAAKQPGPATLHSLAHVLWLHHKLLTSHAIQTALHALEAVQTDHQGTLRILDIGLHHLLSTNSAASAIDFLTATLRDGKITIESYSTTVSELKRNNRHRLYEIVVRWFLSGSMALCDSVRGLVDFEDKKPFDTSVGPLGLTPLQQIFICRKAIGFLFMRPVACCSIIASVLRAGDAEVVGPATDLLFDPFLLNYGGSARDYLKNIPSTDAAYNSIQKALANDSAYYAGLESVGEIKELHPSDYQRDVLRQRTHDDMRDARKSAENQSVLFNMVHRSTLLYGKRSLTYVLDDDGSSRAIALDLQSIGMSFEWPRREILDPVGLDHMLRVYRVEKLK
jgi:hypothetical protein